MSELSGKGRLAVRGGNVAEAVGLSDELVKIRDIPPLGKGSPSANKDKRMWKAC
jgi:hypothetical protein